VVAEAVPTTAEGARMILDVHEVTKQFGGLTAVDRVSFSLEGGEILGLIGPNGAGKTTLFNCVNGVYPPTKGKITFKGKNITGKHTYDIARLGLSRTHQIVRPLNELTVRDNVIAGACYGKDDLSIKAATETADEVLETVRLTQRAEVLAESLNVAQKKRLELARALAAGPDLLLLDEVLAGLNNTEVSGMLDTIRHIRDRGVTIIMIEHIMHAIMNLSDRIIVLNYGKMIADGPPADVSQNEQVIEAYLGNPELAEQILEEGRA
jgi:branched-chain amino acid transport system ATP-binding protein